MEANLLIAAGAGFLGALVMTMAIYGFKSAGVSLDIPYLLGSRIMPSADSSTILITGNILHLVLGALWGVVYVFILTAMQVTPNWPAGILFGFAHGIFIGVMISTLSENHPHIGEGKAFSDPGMFGSEWGEQIPYVLLGLHILFGIVTLGLYHLFFQ